MQCTVQQQPAAGEQSAAQQLIYMSQHWRHHGSSAQQHGGGHASRLWHATVAFWMSCCAIISHMCHHLICGLWFCACVHVTIQQCCHHPKFGSHSSCMSVPAAHCCKAAGTCRQQTPCSPTVFHSPVEPAQMPHLNLRWQCMRRHCSHCSLRHPTRHLNSTHATSTHHCAPQDTAPPAPLALA